MAILATSGTVMSKIIQQELGKKHIQTLLPDERQQQKIMEIIYKQIKAGRSVEIEEFEQIGTQLQQRGAQKLLLGCTELSLLKRDFTLNQAYADVLEILASAVVTYNGLPVKRISQTDTGDKIMQRNVLEYLEETVKECRIKSHLQMIKRS